MNNLIENELKKMICSNINNIGTNVKRSNRSTTLLHAILAVNNAFELGVDQIDTIQIECNKEMIGNSHSDLHTFLKNIPKDIFNKISLESNINVDSNIDCFDGDGYSDRGMNVDARITTIEGVEHLYFYKQENSSINKNTFNYFNASLGETMRVGRTNGSRKLHFTSVTPRKSLMLKNVSTPERSAVIETTTLIKARCVIIKTMKELGAVAEKIYYDIEESALNKLLVAKNKDFSSTDIINSGDILNFDTVDLLSGVANKPSTKSNSKNSNAPMTNR